MSDIHPLPLLEHDLPLTTSFDEPELKARVFPRRQATGRQEWFWRLKVRYAHQEEWIESTLLHGPYLSNLDATKAAEDHMELL